MTESKLRCTLSPSNSRTRIKSFSSSAQACSHSFRNFHSRSEDWYRRKHFLKQNTCGAGVLGTKNTATIYEISLHQSMLMLIKRVGPRPFNITRCCCQMRRYVASSGLLPLSAWESSRQYSGTARKTFFLLIFALIVMPTYPDYNKAPELRIDF